MSCSLPRLLPYNKLITFLNEVDIGTLKSVREDFCSDLELEDQVDGCYLTVILQGRTGYELIYITNEALGRVGYYQHISGKFEKNNCFSKFSSNSLDFFR